MLNEEALKMVGPTLEEVGIKTKGTVSPATTPTVAASIVVTTAYVPVSYSVGKLASWWK